VVAAQDLAADVARHRWYHTIDLGGGVVTKGMFDHRASVDRYLLPESTAGLRCLDVGTMDGFWAFELERRGATEVVAVDLEDPEKLDWPIPLRTTIERTLDETKSERFGLVRSALGSRVDRRLCSVYELDPAELGTFDLVFCGDLLCHLKDPIKAVERIRSVCRATAVIATPIVKTRFNEKTPLARLDGIDEFDWWDFNQAGLERLVLAAGFARVEAARPFQLPAAGGGPWRGLRGVVRGTV
jgi:tRNA (mo5U34)-methyltransferase